MQIKITTTTGNGYPAGKLADAELWFTDGPLAGLKLIGFGIWERRDRYSLNVTFPARQYSVNGERRSFALLRPADGNINANDPIRNAIIDAYRAHRDGTTQPQPQPQPQPTLTAQPEPQPAQPQPEQPRYIATPAGPVDDRTMGTAADYSSRADFDF
jgi:hypothetical protein